MRSYETKHRSSIIGHAKPVTSI